MALLTTCDSEVSFQAASGVPAGRGRRGGRGGHGSPGDIVLVLGQRGPEAKPRLNLLYASGLAAKTWLEASTSRRFFQEPVLPACRQHFNGRTVPLRSVLLTESALLDVGVSMTIAPP